jgi:hypothetical protein
MKLQNRFIAKVYFGQVLPKGVDFLIQAVAASTHNGVSTLAVRPTISKSQWPNLRVTLHIENSPRRDRLNVGRTD